MEPSGKQFLARARMRGPWSDTEYFPSTNTLASPVKTVDGTEPASEQRRRSTTFRAENHPFATPLTAEEDRLKRLITAINRDNEREKQEQKKRESVPEFQPNPDFIAFVEASRANLRKFEEDKAAEAEAQARFAANRKFEEEQRAEAEAEAEAQALFAANFKFGEDEATEAYARPRFTANLNFEENQRAEAEAEHEVEAQALFAANLKFGADNATAAQARFEANLKSQEDRRARAEAQAPFEFNMMNYQNYLDSSAGVPSNPRQAPPSPSQNMNHANGMNGGGMGIGGMVGLPTPAGHQSDLNFIMSMVEDLSRQLEHNQRLTDGVVDKIGKVREKAKTMDLTNDEMMALVSAEMNEDTKNLEKECAELRKKLEKSEYNKEESWKLVIHGCNILSDILEKMHKFKEQHEIDTLTWHKNYRKQLADEREENLALRNQINDMRASACRANEHLRGLRRALSDNNEMEELRIKNHAFRAEKRYWKRMALPLIPDDDSEWSDDDDLIDPEEKKRVAAEAAEKARKEKEGEGDGGQGQTA